MLGGHWLCVRPCFHLSAHERLQIYRLSREGLSQAEIARRLGRDKGTINRELRLKEAPAAPCHHRALGSRGFLEPVPQRPAVADAGFHRHGDRAGITPTGFGLRAAAEDPPSRRFRPVRVAPADPAGAPARPGLPLSQPGPGFCWRRSGPRPMLTRSGTADGDTPIALGMRF